MSTKYDLVSYLAGILSIIESKEDAGQDRGGWLAEEYTRAYGELNKLVKEEKENEARNRQQPNGGHEAGADRAGSESRRS